MPNKNGNSNKTIVRGTDCVEFTDIRRRNSPQSGRNIFIDLVKKTARTSKGYPILHNSTPSNGRRRGSLRPYICTKALSRCTWVVSESLIIGTAIQQTSSQPCQCQIEITIFQLDPLPRGAKQYTQLVSLVEPLSWLGDRASLRYPAWPNSTHSMLPLCPHPLIIYPFCRPPLLRRRGCRLGPCDPLLRVMVTSLRFPPLEPIAAITWFTMLLVTFLGRDK